MSSMHYATFRQLDVVIFQRAQWFNLNIAYALFHFHQIWRLNDGKYQAIYSQSIMHEALIPLPSI